MKPGEAKMSNNKPNFELRSWYDQIVSEKQRLETEMSRVDKLLDALNSFFDENSGQSNLQDVDNEFEQLSTLNKKIQLLYFLLDVIRSLSGAMDQQQRIKLVIEKAS